MHIPKRNSLIAASIVVILLAGTVAGFLLVRSRHAEKPAAGKQTVGDHTISLNQSNLSDSSGLSVSGQAGSLGQLNGNKGSQSQSSGGAGDTASDAANPATFSQYDKYQSSPNALFGEIQAGNGPALAVGQKANIYYKVWLTNGALIDHSPVSASGQPQPFSFTLGAHQIIPGLEQGVAGMKVGGTRLVIVPPAVGYGAQGQGAIPPNAVLVFEVQLLSAQ